MEMGTKESTHKMNKQSKRETAKQKAAQEEEVEARKEITKFADFDKAMKKLAKKNLLEQSEKEKSILVEVQEDPKS